MWIKTKIRNSPLKSPQIGYSYDGRSPFLIIDKPRFVWMDVVNTYRQLRERRYSPSIYPLLLHDPQEESEVKTERMRGWAKGEFTDHVAVRAIYFCTLSTNIARMQAGHLERCCWFQLAWSGGKLEPDCPQLLCTLLQGEEVLRWFIEAYWNGFRRNDLQFDLRVVWRYRFFPGKLLRQYSTSYGSERMFRIQQILHVLYQMKQYQIKRNKTNKNKAHNKTK